MNKFDKKYFSNLSVQRLHQWFRPLNDLIQFRQHLNTLQISKPPSIYKRPGAFRLYFLAIHFVKMSSRFQFHTLKRILKSQQCILEIAKGRTAKFLPSHLFIIKTTLKTSTFMNYLIFLSRNFQETPASPAFYLSIQIA